MEQTFLLTAARKAMLVAFFATVPAFSLPSLADTVKSVNIQQQAGGGKGSGIRLEWRARYWCFC